MSRAGVFWVALFVLFSGGMLIWGGWKNSRQSPTGHGEVLTVAKDHDYGKGEKWIHDFTLTERSGRVFDSKELEGHVWVTSVFFATCPSLCRQQNQLVRELQQQFGDKGVRFLSITCDPANDTPERLREYARSFDADANRWLFVTAPDLTYLRRVAGERFGIAVTGAQGHANQFTVIDKWGNNRGFFGWTDPVKMVELRRMLEELLVESEPPQPSAPDRVSEPDDEEADAADQEAEAADTEPGPEDGESPPEPIPATGSAAQ